MVWIIQIYLNLYKKTKSLIDDKITQSLDIKAKDESKKLPKTSLYNLGKAIIEEIENNYKIATEKQIIIRGENNWYKFCSIVIEQLKKDGIYQEILYELLIHHLIESLNFDDTLNLLNYIYNNNLNEFETKIKNYFDSNILVNKTTNGLLLLEWNVDKNKPTSGKSITKLIVLNPSTQQWNIAEPEDISDLSNQIKEKVISKIN